MMLHRLEVIPTSESHSFPEYKRFLGMPYINATEFTFKNWLQYYIHIVFFLILFYSRQSTISEYEKC